MEWRWCLGFEGRYEVSNTGIVRSWVKPGPSGDKRAVPLILRLNRAGGRSCNYLQVQLGMGNQRYVHRLVVEAFIGEISPGLEVDHIDRDPENNHVDNLRLTTRALNCVKRKSKKRTSSKYKGATFNKRLKRWSGHISIESKTCNLGLFATEEEAALAYDEAAREHHGEFAVLNFPVTGNT